MIEYYCPREIPEVGYLVMDGRFNLQLAYKDDRGEYEDLANRLQDQVNDTVYVILCVYKHCVYLTTKVHIRDQAKAKEVCRTLGHYCTLKCDTGRPYMLIQEAENEDIIPM